MSAMKKEDIRVTGKGQLDAMAEDVYFRLNGEGFSTVDLPANSLTKADIRSKIKNQIRDDFAVFWAEEDQRRKKNIAAGKMEEPLPTFNSYLKLSRDLEVGRDIKPYQEMWVKEGDAFITRVMPDFKMSQSRSGAIHEMRRTLIEQEMVRSLDNLIHNTCAFSSEVGEKSDQAKAEAEFIANFLVARERLSPGEIKSLTRQMNFKIEASGAAIAGVNGILANMGSNEFGIFALLEKTKEGAKIIEENFNPSSVRMYAKYKDDDKYKP